MTVYVDSLNKHRNGYWCHMVADTIKELDDMALMIGLKTEWRQTSSSGIVHYDLRLSKRKLAIEFGALECGPAKLIEIGDKTRANRLRKED